MGYVRSNARRGVIQIFNVGAERMLVYAAADVLNTITPADISDPQEVIARAVALSGRARHADRIRKDGRRFPAVVSVTALRDDQHALERRAS